MRHVTLWGRKSKSCNHNCLEKPCSQWEKSISSTSNNFKTNFAINSGESVTSANLILLYIKYQRRFPFVNIQNTVFWSCCTFSHMTLSSQISWLNTFPLLSSAGMANFLFPMHRFFFTSDSDTPPKIHPLQLRMYGNSDTSGNLDSSEKLYKSMPIWFGSNQIYESGQCNVKPLQITCGNHYLSYRFNEGKLSRHAKINSVMKEILLKLEVPSLLELMRLDCRDKCKPYGMIYGGVMAQ